MYTPHAFTYVHISDHPQPRHQNAHRWSHAHTTVAMALMSEASPALNLRHSSCQADAYEIVDQHR